MKTAQSITSRILIALLLIVFLYLVLSWYAGSGPFASSSDTAVRNREKYAVGWEGRGANSTVEELQNLVRTADEGLADPSINETGKKRLLLQKASAIATPRTLSPNTENLLEAMAILKSVYESEPKDDTDVLLKNLTIPLYLGVLRGSCYLPAIAVNLPRAYKDFYDGLVKAGDNPSAALIRAFREFAYKGLDAKFGDDKATVSSRAYISALYLYSFGKKESKSDQDILKSLKEDVERFASLKKQLITSVIGGDVSAAQTYAFAYDIAHTYGVSKVDPNINSSIDANYDRVYKEADKITKDENTKAVMKALNSFYYLESLHRRYSDKDRDAAKVARIIDTMIASISVSKETQKVFPGFLIAGQSEGGKWMKVRTNFYEIAAKYPKLKNFLEKTGGLAL